MGSRTFPETNRGVETSTVPTAKLSADDGHSDVFHGAAADTAPGPVVENFQPPSTLLVLITANDPVPLMKVLGRI